MDKFSIDYVEGNKKYIPYLLKEIKTQGLICGTEKDRFNDTVYHTHNLVAIKKIIDDYEGLILDVHKK